MYCNTCMCEYEGWTGRCPQCKNPLRDVSAVEAVPDGQKVDLESFVDLIKSRGGEVNFHLKAYHVVKKRAKRFPWLGYGFAWTKKLQGAADGIIVDLQTSKIGKDKRFGFPYKGFGYAWREEMQGNLAGNQITVQATEVRRKKSWRFPYNGYGYAWTEKMIGRLGEDLSISLVTERVSQNRGWIFPYFGFGYAWADEAILTVSLIK